jgi:hypothetical protein
VSSSAATSTRASASASKSRRSSKREGTNAKAGERASALFVADFNPDSFPAQLEGSVEPDGEAVRLRADGRAVALDCPRAAAEGDDAGLRLQSVGVRKRRTGTSAVSGVLRL